ncbi:mrna guanylyltransferase [Fusarium longipes]|uniref:mRNA-capping enzyme subunit alpha n=1 Tax=Fusarium longipes TaxID=694270 RepID=A0A395T7C5_9HYPO|nr:mrna guanylyltransferase [Fusarium longipes]
MAQQDGPITSISEPGVKAQDQLLHEMRREVANLLGRSQTGFPGAQPVSFSRQHLDELTHQDYYVVEKSDGIRYLLYSTTDENGNEAHYLIDRKNDFWFIRNRSLHFPLESSPEAFHTNTLIDGELVWDTRPDGKREPVFLVFDCLVLDGQLLMERTLDKRLAYFTQRFYRPYKKLYQEYPQEKEYQPFYVELKEPQLAYAIDMMFRDILPNLKHGNDGLIFTCRTTPYKHGTDTHILKWKPPEENTIDFRLRLSFPQVDPTESERREGITEPFIDYDSIPKAELYVFKGNSGPDKYEFFHDAYINEEEWETLKSLNDPLDWRIVECNIDEHGRWRIVRFRDDKNEANHTSVTKSVLQSIEDRVSEKDLYRAAGDIKNAWKARASRGSK